MNKQKTIHFDQAVSDVVVIPRQEYDALTCAAEARADAAAYDRAKRDLASGEDELIPEEFADRLLAGENPVRVYRNLRGLTIQSLAKYADVSPAYLSQIETGKRDGTMTTMKSLAAALNVTLDDLA
ncbi:MAG TPA: XRE family transcriptional regulator [Rhodospirillales bacterium]|nr:XRE family transcriptional regulator [Rhodospirillales bacterium]